MKYKHIFGPVHSRRLGISLGVDLIPYKVCNFDCIYCEVGHTTNLTNTRDHYVDLNALFTELDEYLSTQPILNYITFSGAGEPTLNKDISQIINYIKENYPQYPLALITNSSLLYCEDVRNEILDVDLILPSLDAVSESVFQKINRSDRHIHSQQIIEGLIAFRKIYKGKIFLEIFIVEGINDTESELILIKEACQLIQADKIQLNSLDRTGCEDWVKPCNIDQMNRVKDFLNDLPVELITKNKDQQLIQTVIHSQVSDLIALLNEEPKTLQDLILKMDIHANTVIKYLKNLLNSKVIIEVKDKLGLSYFKINS